MKDDSVILDFRQKYLSHRDINNYLELLQAKYPQLVCVKTIGYSFEKRTLKSIYISVSVEKLNESPKQPKRTARNAKSSSISGTTTRAMRRFNDGFIPSAHQRPKTMRKPVILIDGGMHAREWCTISSALYCASQLTDNFDANKHLLDAFDFVIVPIVNADGYEYSRKFQKMWRKSRRPILYSKFIGVDFNRNFSVGWDTACAKTSSCTFRGERPFSEPETRIMKQLMYTLKPTFYLTLHSYSQSIMFPYAFTNSPPGNWLKLQCLAKAGHSAIQKATGTNFRIGSAASIIKNAKCAGGGSLDYAYKMAKIPFVIAMELSGKSFHPPPHKINNIICESWIGIRAMCSCLKTEIMKINFKE